MEQYRLYLTCDMFKSSLKHIHDLVLLSLKVEVFSLSFLLFFRAKSSDRSGEEKKLSMYSF